MSGTTAPEGWRDALCTCTTCSKCDGNICHACGNLLELGHKLGCSYTCPYTEPAQ